MSTRKFITTTVLLVIAFTMLAVAVMVTIDRAMNRVEEMWFYVRMSGIIGVLMSITVIATRLLSIHKKPIESGEKFQRTEEKREEVGHHA